MCEGLRVCKEAEGGKKTKQFRLYLVNVQDYVKISIDYITTIFKEITNFYFLAKVKVDAF